MHTHRRHLLTLLLFGALLAGPTACGNGGKQSGTTTTGIGSTTTTRPSTTTTAASTTSSTEAPGKQTEVRSYFLRDEKVGPVARQATGNAEAAGAMKGLLAGPTAAEQQLGFTSAVPGGTELLGVVIKDRIATVDLSQKFASGGGSASMMGRVAQVVFTVTQFSTVDAVAFELEGKPVTALGGEGLVLDKPQTRADWEGLSPAILVESPLPFAEVTSPLRITGTANTFEAAFRVKVTDGGGHVVYDEPAMATSGNGTRGTFDINATFDVSSSGLGDLTVWEDSAQDGSHIHVVKVPLHLAP